MKRIYKINLFIFIFLASSVSYLFSSSSGYTGASSSGCSCHGSSNSNTSVTLSSANGFSVEPGGKLNLTVKVTNTSMSKAGINIAVKDRTSGGSIIGNVTAGTNLKKIGNELTHGSTGGATLDGNGEANFEFEWTAPTTPGIYYIQAAGNAVNGNRGTGGDQWNLLSARQVTVKGITLITLNGGQEICSNETVDIKWTQFGLTNVKIELSKNGGSSYDETIVSSTSADEGSYTWNLPSDLSGNNLRIRISDVSNSDINNTSSADFAVVGSPEITSQPQDISSCVNESISLTFTAEGSNLSYQWYKDDVVLQNAINSELIIENIKQENVGAYKCEVKNSCAEVFTNSVSVTLGQLPEITSVSDDIEAPEGVSVQMTVEAQGDNLIFEWFKDGEKITDQNGNFLVINDVRKENEGNYTCKVSNDCGYIESTPIKLTIKNPGEGGKLELSKEIINFGNVKIGEKKDILIDDFFKNIGDDNLLIRGVDIVSQNTLFTMKELFVFTLEPDQIKDLLVTFRPQEIGEFSAELHIILDVDGEPIIVQLTGIGVESNNAEVVSSVNSINFGEIEIFLTKSEELILKNMSNEVAASLIDISFSGNQFKLTEELNLPIEIQTQEELNLFINFIPSIEGEINEKLIFIFSNSESIEVNLTGNSVFGSVTDYFESINIFPNPSNQGINIKFNSIKSDSFEIKIIDLHGNIIYDYGKRNLTLGENILLWNLQSNNGVEVSSGVYSILIQNSKMSIIEKLIIE